MEIGNRESESKPLQHGGTEAAEQQNFIADCADERGSEKSLPLISTDDTDLKEHYSRGEKRASNRNS
jgi:hypothetical protein